jgi:hypothetical protein
MDVENVVLFLLLMWLEKSQFLSRSLVELSFEEFANENLLQLDVPRLGNWERFCHAKLVPKPLLLLTGWDRDTTLRLPLAVFEAGILRSERCWVRAQFTQCV